MRNPTNVLKCLMCAAEVEGLKAVLVLAKAEVKR